MTQVSTKYLFRCKCGREMRMYSPNAMTCPDCTDHMEMAAVLKIYPGFGIGRMSVKAYFGYDIAKPVDRDDATMV